jgi:hypothetical protein
MRMFLLLLTLLFAAPALGQEWTRYENARFGYSVSVPPGFVGGVESQNGDGQSFAHPAKPIKISVWGGPLRGELGDEVERRKTILAESAWRLTRETITPRWAELSLIQGARILVRRMILLCGGQSYAALSSEYSVTDSADMEPLLARMALSLKGTC